MLDLEDFKQEVGEGWRKEASCMPYIGCPDSWAISIKAITAGRTFEVNQHAAKNAIRVRMKLVQTSTYIPVTKARLLQAGSYEHREQLSCKTYKYYFQTFRRWKRNVHEEEATMFSH